MAVIGVDLGEGLAWEEGPIEGVVRDVVQIQKNLFEHESQVVVVWALCVL